MPKSIQSAIFGKLVPAIIRAFGRKVTGIDMTKVNHIMNKAQHGFDMLDPSEIVWMITEIVASQVTGLGYVKLVLTTGQIIKITVKMLTTGTVGIGTAYIIGETANLIDKI